MELLQQDTPIFMHQYCDFVLPSVQLFLDENTPMPLDGCTFLSQIRKSRNDASGSPLAVLSVSVVDNANGVVSVTLSNTSMATLFANALAATQPILNPNVALIAFWDLIITDSGAIKTQVLRGPALLNFGVSH